MVKINYFTTHRCALYTPGHNVHFIQARKSWQNPEAGVAAEFLTIEDDVIVVRAESGDVLKFRNHDLKRFARIIHDFGPHVTLRDPGVLRIEHTGSGYLFCVKPDVGAPLDRCIDPDDVPRAPTDRSPEAIAKYLIDRIHGEGGGTMQL
ncbi:MAG: hypothetical protein H7288_12725 [Kineosporiaceae bacterium]|nr:hypothetical protein [Aeromicrobium sp.]